MNPFRTPQETYDASIVLDASTVGDTTVTVATYATRRQELEILDSIYEYGSHEGVRPFIEKATDYDWSVPSAQRMITDVLRANRQHLRAVSHNSQVHGNSDTQQIEALHSAILVDEMLREVASDEVAGQEATGSPPKPLVIVDGGEQTVKPFLNALDGIRAEQIPVTYCVKAELYYPPALLADFTANYLAHAIEEGTYSYADPILPAPVAKETKRTGWNNGIEGIKQRRAGFDSVDVKQRRGETARERVCCWFEGVVASGKGVARPMTDSINRVARHATERGYERLATRIRKL